MVIARAGLAVDWVGGNMYWSDPQRMVVEVARLDGRHRYVLVETAPHAVTCVAVDAARGWLFLGGGGWVQRARPDGSERELLHNGTGVADIALDVQVRVRVRACACACACAGPAHGVRVCACACRRSRCTGRRRGRARCGACGTTAAHGRGWARAERTGRWRWRWRCTRTRSTGWTREFPAPAGRVKTRRRVGRRTRLASTPLFIRPLSNLTDIK